MKEFDETPLDSKKDDSAQVQDAADEDDEPPSYEDITNVLVLLVERDGSKRRIYKRKDTGEILYTTRNYNGFKGYIKYFFHGAVSSENEVPKSDDFTSFAPSSSSKSASTTVLPYAIFDNFNVQRIHPETGTRTSSIDKRFFTQSNWKTGGSNELFIVQGITYKLSAGLKGQVVLRRPNENRKDPPLAYFKHKTFGLGTDQGSVTINPSLVYDGPPESAPPEALLVNGKPTLLLDAAIVGDFSICRLVEAQAALTAGCAFPKLCTKSETSETLF